MGNDWATFFFALAGLCYALQGDYPLMAANVCLSMLYLGTDDRKMGS